MNLRCTTKSDGIQNVLWDMPSSFTISCFLYLKHKERVYGGSNYIRICLKNWLTIFVILLYVVMIFFGLKIHSYTFKLDTQIRPCFL